ncbi:MAG: DNA-formamidopyrimidine glycosylase family protein, partial [Bauldia sp.]
MPELPEVETVRRGLLPVMEGARIDKVEQRRKDLRIPFPRGFAGKLAGRMVMSLGRRAKYLLADLDDGMVLIMHLGMSGSFRIEAEGETATPGGYYHARAKLRAHDHVVIHMSSGVRVIFNDPRRFG